MRCPFRSHPARAQSGQSAVETAVVLPLFVFLILGILQLGLMHQARLLTKYAAYKAVRAGSIHNASVAEMEKAAVAVLLPMLAKRAEGPDGIEYVRPVGSGQEFTDKWNEMAGNRMDKVGLKYAEVTICGPTREDLGGGSGELDFDDPDNATSDNWRQSQRTKLRVQVTFNYRLIIPFADRVIYYAARGRDLHMSLRLGQVKDDERSKVAQRRFGSVSTGEGPYEGAASKGVYIAPIRATYTMRMQSNLYLNTSDIPSRNACLFPFSY
ncbi:pilus assembly protein [Myxococcus sp. MISCRS1]|uniref:TadE/TadG family type IV pilus assembly protein n=1 Tax=Myxococcus TaxID=32 RepID=UPI001CBC0F60|nr:MULTISPECIES: TadE/TadG family type IV pilus assembly protein [unclassified Myxococcus]MBZ4397628.1 pilus assembly protein [Myxococcus sp. AS-1-15]MBZ4407804.1 pilus assembly protein [Myxococcus sp. XM-1-1-1]MCY0998277.1 pilus assembly protein [Myxococcus sp. MISCRS1]BDT31654.1 pilus assembly protein [Myxococcus sp. MH1]